MYVIVQHEIIDPQTAFTRGVQLMKGEGAPAGARVLQFFPSTDASTVVCLWEAGAVAPVQEYVNTVLGDASRNSSYEVDGAQAFAERPGGLAIQPAILA